MNKYFVFCILYFVFCINTIAQKKHGKIWVSGINGKQIIFDNNIVTTKQGVCTNKYFADGNSNICDSNGNLILLSDGYNIYDTLGNYLDGGDTLIPKDFYLDQDGWSVLPQTSIFLPMDSGIYYFITPTESNTRFADCNAGINCYMDLMLYNVIDMKANNGAGKVVKRMVPILENANLRKTQMMACRHGNGKDWWLLKQEGDSANVHTFLFTQDSVYDKGVQVFDDVVWGTYDLRGMSTFNPVGNQYASTSISLNIGIVFLADFDRCYGTLSNPHTIEMPLTATHNPNDTIHKEHSPVALAYSPNGQFIYVISRWNVYQYDLQDKTWFHVAGLDTTWQEFNIYSSSYLGPNNKIYIGNFNGLSKQMSVIDNPDIKGVGCNFCPRCLRTDSLFYGFLDTPPCMPNYGLGARVCYPEQSTEYLVESNEIKVYPNPTDNMLNIQYNITKNAKFIIMDLLGRKVIETSLSDKNNFAILDVSILSTGVYIYQLSDDKKILKSNKLIIK